VTPQQAIVLGIAQGVAEVVPVSSSAQLALLPPLLGWEPPPHRTLVAAALHAGSCAGIALALRRELADVARRPAEVVTLALTCMPAAAAGALVDDAVERRLGEPRVTATLMSAAGLALWAADRRSAGRSQVRGTDLAAAAVAQIAALAPGVSRSGAVLTALRLLGVDRAAAARTSLLMSLPVTAGAALVPLARADSAALRRAAPLLATGVPAAAASGAVAAAAWRRRPSPLIGPSVVYRLAVAALVLSGRRAVSRQEPARDA
jgi:undecaprenyl-diphosphatase